MGNNIKHLTPDDYKITKWSGGETTQVIIYPYDADFSQKDFIFRVSSATVELPESDFTDFHDYDRLICTLKGTMDLTHEGDPEHYHLNEYEVHAFDGAVKTHSVGSCTDFNLMLRKGQAEGSAAVIHLDHDSVHIDLTSSEARKTSCLLFCGNGSVSVHSAEYDDILNGFEALFLEDPCECRLRLQSAGKADLVLLKIEMK